MSRPIFSRPRTRVYGCNYDKGESYYKPMVDHLDRKYSSRPLFSEPRTSFADEIAARRSDIGSRGDQSAAHSSLRDLDPDYDIPPRSRNRAFELRDNEEETVYDIRGRRSTRGGAPDDFAKDFAKDFANDFANEISSTSRRSKARSDLHRSERETSKVEADIKMARSAAKSAFEEAERTFERRSKLPCEESENPNSALTRWSRVTNDEHHQRDHLASIVGSCSAAGRAKQTKARLDDLENEMEEMAERRAKRERRSAALRALVNENFAPAATADEQFQQQQQQQQQQQRSSLATEKLLTVRSEKHVNF